MKYYLINAEIFEGYPDYTFIVQASDEFEAMNYASEIIDKDYPDGKNKPFWHEIKDLKHLINLMIL